LGPPAGIPQPKLAIGSVDDPLKHEADHVAGHVMRMSMASNIAEAVKRP
jgi:hypothetical protein